MTHIRAVDWVNQFGTGDEQTSLETPASEMTVEHLGESATQADLVQFREWVTELMRRTGMDEQMATDAVWNNGNYHLGAVKCGLTDV